MKQTRCKHKKHILHGEDICPRGCDYIRARELNKLAIEKELGLKYEEVFFMFEGLSLKAADGGEVPVLEISMGGQTIRLEAEAAQILYRQMYKGWQWAEKGYCGGIC